MRHRSASYCIIFDTMSAGYSQFCHALPPPMQLHSSALPLRIQYQVHLPATMSAHAFPSFAGYPRHELPHAWAAPLSGDPRGQRHPSHSPLPRHPCGTAAPQSHVDGSQPLNQPAWGQAAGHARGTRPLTAMRQKESEHAAGQGRSRQGPSEGPIMAARSASEPVRAVVAQAAVPVAHQVCRPKRV